MQPLRRLFGNGANATVFRIAATHSYRRQPALTPAQEIVAVALRETLLWSLDDPMAVVREFLSPTMSRSGRDPVCVGMVWHAFVTVQPRRTNLSTVA